MLNTIATSSAAIDRTVLTWVLLAGARDPGDIEGIERASDACEAVVGHDLISDKHFEGDGAFAIGIELGIRLAIAIVAQPLDPMADVKGALEAARKRAGLFIRDCRSEAQECRT